MIITSKLPPAIIFFGPDGSGKTTQADLLVHELRINGIKTKKVWLRSLHTLAYVISNFAMHILDLQDIYEFRAKYSNMKSFRKMWHLIEFISILPLILFKFHLPLSRGYTLVAERYVIDWIVSLSYVSRNESLLDSSLAKSALRFIPRNSLLIFIDANYDALCSRGRKEESFEFIEFQRRLYAKIALMLNSVVIDTSDKNKQQVHKIICHHALKLYPSHTTDHYSE